VAWVIAAKTTEPLDPKQFAHLGPTIRDALLERVQAGVLPVGESLHQVFADLFGSERTRQEWYLFLLLAAPMARKIAIERANSGDRIGNTHISVADLKMWLWWLDTMDPLSASMIDLHYFAGLSFKETAAVLDLPPQSVLRDVRFAKAWLMLRLN
jgi:DNA-directed RNA polymerase specialized sigma24 family protein